jgi:hypothetical protein
MRDLDRLSGTRSDTSENRVGSFALYPSEVGRLFKWNGGAMLRS